MLLFKKTMSIWEGAFLENAFGIFVIAFDLSLDYTNMNS
jgi:hypothetical protein